MISPRNKHKVKRYIGAMKTKNMLYGALFLGLLGSIGCMTATPDCPEEIQAPLGASPKSAGCFAVYQGGLLVVQEMSEKVNLPGGSNIDGESGRCTAFRETWEETGLRLMPGKLLAVFDTGFHLYECQHDVYSGAINPPLRMEVRSAFYLKAESFENYEWRFPDQKPLLKQLMSDSADHVAQSLP